MESIGNRLKQLRGSVSGEEFAKRLGVNLQTLYRYERGERKPDIDFVQLVSSEMGVSIEWFITGTDASQKREVSNAQPTDGFVGAKTCGCDVNLIMIPRVAARLAAGTGSLETDGDVLGMYAFRSDWIVRKGNTSQMVLMDVIGDSMQPEIKHGDMVLIDQSKTNILGYGYFAVGIDDAVYVKQLRSKPGKLILHSLNPDYEDIEVDMAADNPRDVRIIGRVLWVGRELD